MRRLIIALAVVMLEAAPVMSAQQTDAMAPVRQFIDGFNKGDVKVAKAACIDDLLIIDDFAPHVWRGPEAISKWLDDLNKFGKNNDSSGWFVTLRKPRHFDLTGTYGYVVVPTKLSYKKKGQPVEDGGLMTLVLQKTADGWRITAWSWADD